MSAERFMQLVVENQGFEFVQAYKDDVDLFLGGKDGTFWYVIMKNGKVKESYIATYENGSWKDQMIKGTGAAKSVKDIAAGTTIREIVDKAYLAQNEEWVQRRIGKTRVIEDQHPHFHYVYGFGDKAVDVSSQYGVTIGYSDIKDVSQGFHLRDMSTGQDVEMP